MRRNKWRRRLLPQPYSLIGLGGDLLMASGCIGLACYVIHLWETWYDPFLGLILLAVGMYWWFAAVIMYLNRGGES